MMTSFVSALYFGDPAYGLQRGVEQIVEIVERVSYPLSYVFFGSSDYVFEKVLFLAIIISIVYVVLKKIPIFEESSDAIRWVITIAISLLSTRFLVESELVQAIILPYTVLGVTLTAALPLVIFFFFVINAFPGNDIGHSVMRKVLWILFIVVFLGIGASRAPDIGELSWIYTATSGIAVIFLLADGTINRAILKMKYEELKHDALLQQIQEVNKQIKELDDRQRDSATAFTDSDYRRMRKRFAKNLKRLQKEL